MVDFSEEQQNQVSKYNDAVFSISRLHDMWLRCNTFIRQGNFKAWKFELDLIWLELACDVLRQEDSNNIKKKNELLMRNISNSKKRNQLFFNLMQRHSFLREVQDQAGKAGVYMDENEEGFE